jgi:hypothetical protein
MFMGYCQEVETERWSHGKVVDRIACYAPLPFRLRNGLDNLGQAILFGQGFDN